MVEEHHWIEALPQFHKGNDKESAALTWIKNMVPVYYTVRTDESTLSAMDIMKSRKLLNNVTGYNLPCSGFWDILKDIIAYATTFEYEYGVSFDEARLIENYRDMDSSKFLPSTSDSTYFRYIRAASIC